MLFTKKTWHRIGWWAAGLAGLGVLASIGAALFVYFGVYSVAATEPHTAPVYRLLDIAMRRSVRVRADDIRVPQLSEPGMRELGLQCYRRYCVQCHGAPGVAPGPEAIGLMPLPASLAQTAHEWPASDLYWVTKYGVRMAGMPAWEFRMNERAIWSTVAFLRTLPSLTAADYARLSAATPSDACPADEARPPGTVKERGALLMRQYACITCHKVPGVTGPDVYVGPPLEGFANRTYVAGVLPNTPENVLRFLLDPQSVSPRTLMPDLRLSETHARDLVAYLETLR